MKRHSRKPICAHKTYALGPVEPCDEFTGLPFLIVSERYVGLWLRTESVQHWLAFELLGRAVGPRLLPCDNVFSFFCV